MSQNKTKWKEPDYVVGLLSGKMEERKRKDGTSFTMFVPKIMNKYQPLHNIFFKDKRDEQTILIEEGVHPLRVETNFTTFKKSPAEKQLLKEMKIDHKKGLTSAGLNHKKRMNVGDSVFIHWRAFN